MKAKYVTPDIKIVTISSSSILAGSVSFSDNPSDNGNALARGRRNSFFDDEDYEDE